MPGSLGKYFGDAAVRRLANACNGGGEWDGHHRGIAPPRKSPAYSGATPVGLSDLGTDIIHHIAMVNSACVVVLSPPYPSSHLFRLRPAQGLSGALR
jgi:hypothetical protein